MAAQALDLTGLAPVLTYPWTPPPLLGCEVREASLAAAVPKKLRHLVRLPLLAGVSRLVGGPGKATSHLGS